MTRTPSAHTVIPPLAGRASRGAARSKTALCALSVLAVIGLSACADEELILPGKRESIRSVLQVSEDASLAAVANESQSRAISLGAPTRNASWAQGIGTESYRTTHPALSGAPQLAWSAKIGAGDSRKYRITADPVIAGGRVFTLDASSLISATDAASGAPVWNRDVRPARDGDGDATGGGLAVHNGTLYAATGYGEVIAMNAATGAEKWRQQLDATGSGQPLVHGSLVYVTSGDDTGWAIDADTGRVAWQISGAQSVSNVLGAPAPVIADDLAIFGFGTGELQAVFRRGGLRRWDAAVVGERAGRALSKVNDVTGAPVVRGGTVFAGNQAGRIAAVDARSGGRIWTAREGAVGPVWPAGDSVFAVTDRNELVRLDASNGSKVWGVELPNFIKDKPKKRSEVFTHHGPVVAGGRVIIASSDGVLRSYDPKDGSLLASTAIPSGATTAPAVAGGTLYVVGRSGQLHAFR